MKRTLILTAFAVVVAVTTTGGAQARTLSASEERLKTCLLLELKETHACVAYAAGLILGYVRDPSTNPDEVLGGEGRPVAESLTR